MEKTSVELTHEFFDQWLKTYESTYGRLVEMPAIGPARERSEKITRSFSVYVNLYTAWFESLVNFQNVFIEAMRKTREKMVTGLGEEIKPEMYKDFYRVWIETYSETFKEFLKSGHFSSDMGRLTSYFIDVQKTSRDLLEENVLKPMSLPTRAEIDEMNRELYSLKRTAKRLSKELSENTKAAKTEIDRMNLDLESLKKTVEKITSQGKELSGK